MTRGVSLYLWPLELPDRKLSNKVKRACHALALDDERTTFHPVLWTEEGEQTAKKEAPNIRDQRIVQVWFAGAHANVGGGYPDDSLAHVSLDWVVNEAKRCDLRFKTAPSADPDALVRIGSSQDRDGRLYDSRSGLGGYYRYGPRKISDLCNMTFSRRAHDSVNITTAKIHISAIERRAHGAHVYAPIGFPANYAVVRSDGEIDPSPESADEAAVRIRQQEVVWNYVWWRRILYFATLAASFHLVFFPLLYQTNRMIEFSSALRPVSELLRLIGQFLPGIAGWWIGAFAANPKEFLIGVVVLSALLFYGSAVGSKITDSMDAIWEEKFQGPGVTRRYIHEAIRAFRTNGAVVSFHRAMKRYVIPFVSAFALVYLGLTLVSHLSFNFFDAAGFFCKETDNPHNLIPNEERAITFNVGSFCQPTGIFLERGYRYALTITRSGPWLDGPRESGVVGYEITELPSWRDRFLMWSRLPLRRVFLRPWFLVIARIGSGGNDEYFVDPDSRSGLQDPQNYKVLSAFPTRKSGELFLYVNDAAIGLPWINDLFYWNNFGEAQVTIRRIPR
jgi:hypothetical protein